LPFFAAGLIVLLSVWSYDTWLATSRAGMILAWIRQRGSGSAAQAARFRRSDAEARLAGLGRCAPTATTRRYHE
jgi:hypothetical protein